MSKQAVMKYDISDSCAVDGIAKPIAENPIPEGVKAAEEAIASFEASVQEKAFAATVLSLAMSQTFRRDWLDNPNCAKPRLNDRHFQKGGSIQWMELSEIGLKQDFIQERCFEAVETFLQSLHSPERQRILFSVSSDGVRHSVKIGLQDISGNGVDAAVAKTASAFASANWPGLKLDVLGSVKKPHNEVLAKIADIGNTTKGYSEYAARVRVLTGLPAQRKTKGASIPVTLDRLASSLNGRRWQYLVVAEPVPNVEIDGYINICRDFAGRAESVKSFQFGKSVSSSFSMGFTKNWGRNENTSRPKIDWKSHGVRLASIAAVAVLCPGLIEVVAAGLIAEKIGLAGLRAGAAYLFGKTSVGNDSRGQSYSEAISETVTASKSVSFNENIVNKHAEAIAKLLDAQSDRYERAKALGAWDVGAYFIGEDSETADLGANVLKAVLSGDDSNQEPIRIHTYQGDGVFASDSDPMEALLRYENPNTTLVSIAKEADGKETVTEIPSHPIDERFDALRTVLDTRGLAHFINFPLENIPGIPVRRIPADIGLASDGDSLTGMSFGNQMFRGNVLLNTPWRIPPSILAKHALVCGINGSGKTNTILGILGSLLHDIGAPFLVIEPAKQEYVDWAMAQNRKLAESGYKLAWNDKSGKALPDSEYWKRFFDNSKSETAMKDKQWINVYIPGRETWKGAKIGKLNLNPFDFVWINKGENPKTLEHIDRLKTVINAAMPMQEVLPVLMEELIYMAYGVPKAPRKAGERAPCWMPKDATQRYPEFDESVHLPSFHSLSVQLRHLFKSRTYAKDVQLNLRAALETRIDSFKRGWRKELLNKDAPRHSRADWESLFEHPTVVNLTSLTSDEDKAFFMAVLLLFVYEYRQECSELADLKPLSEKAGKLRHLLVVEEAHRVLGRAEPASSFSANPKQKVSEMFSNMISEVRAYGQGILIADQIPCRLNEDAVTNTNLKIVHKLVSVDDRAAMATALNLWEDQERVIGDLGVGEVLVRGDMDRQAVMVKVNKNV